MSVCNGARSCGVRGDSLVSLWRQSYRRKNSCMYIYVYNIYVCIMCMYIGTHMYIWRERVCSSLVPLWRHQNSCMYGFISNMYVCGYTYVYIERVSSWRFTSIPLAPVSPPENSMYVYIYIYIYIYKYICIYLHRCIFIYVYKERERERERERKRDRGHARGTSPYIYKCIYIYSPTTPRYACIYIYTHKYIYMYMYVYMERGKICGHARVFVWR